MSTVLWEEAVRKDADRFFVFQDDRLPDASGWFFTLERTMLLLYLHKPADLLRVVEKQRGLSLP